VDLTVPGAADAMVNQIMAAAASSQVVNLELTATEARVSFLVDERVITYANRDDQILVIDSDITNVGQAVFDPTAINLTDLGDLFRQAARIAGSDQNQQLQIVDNGQEVVHLVVTTNPESVPVFFTHEAALVPTLDPLNPADLAIALAEVVAEARLVTRIGITADGTVYADKSAGWNQTLRTTRAPRFPVRDQVKTTTPGVIPYDPSLVSARAIIKILQVAGDHLDRDPSQGFKLVIEQIDKSGPSAKVTMGVRTVHLTLSATIIA
jgi:hypothetical protein